MLSSQVLNYIKKANKLAVPINNSNLWRLGNTKFLETINKKLEKRSCPFMVGDLVYFYAISGQSYQRTKKKMGKLLSIIKELDHVIVD